MTKKGSKKRSQNRARNDFGGVNFHMRVFIPKDPFGGHLGFLLAPQGLILGSFGSHVGPLKAQIWGHVVPMFAPSVSARFKNVLHVAPTITPKTFKNILSTRLSQKLPYHRGRRYREAFYDIL